MKTIKKIQIKTFEQILSERSTSLHLDMLAGKCKEILELYSHLQTKDYSSVLITAVLQELIVSINHMRMQPDGLRDLTDDKTKCM